jgi:hypothetical protein
MFWGFGGYAQPSTIPSSWSQASSLIGSGPGKVLALPGDQYLPFSWTQQRSVANPLTSYFERDVIIDGHLDLGGTESQTADARSRYLRFITDSGSRTRRFGNLVAPLGVRYVLVAKTADWSRYSWLRDQSDLRLVRSWPDLELFENVEPVATAYAPGSAVQVRNWGEVIGLADDVRLTDVAVTVRNAVPGPIRDPEVQLAAAPSRPLPVTDQSPVHYGVATDGAGSVVLTQPFDPAWRLDGEAAIANLGVTNLFRAPGNSGIAEIRYTRWPLVRTGYLLSAVFIALAVGASVLEPRRRRVRR